MSSSNLVRIAFVPEDVYGETPDGVEWDTMRKVSESLSGTPTTTESEEARSDRQAGGQIQVGLELGGDITYEVAASQCYKDHILAGMKDEAWSVALETPAEAFTVTVGPPAYINSTTVDFTTLGIRPGDMVRLKANDPAFTGEQPMLYVTAIQPNELSVIGRGLVDGPMPATTTIERPEFVQIGQTDHSFSMEKNFLDLSDKTIMYRGMLVDGLSLAFTYGEISQGSFTYIGNGYDTPDVPETDNDVVIPATSEIPYNATSDIGLVLIDDEAGNPVDANFCIQSLSVELANNHQAEECIGDLAPGAYSAGTASITVEMSGYLADENFHYVQKKIDQTPVEIAYYAENQDGGIAVHVFEAQLSFDDPASGGRDQIVTMDMSGTARYSEQYGNSMRIYFWENQRTVIPAGGAITAPSGDTVAPATFFLSGDFLAGTTVDINVTTDVDAVQTLSWTSPFDLTSAQAAADFAANVTGTNITISSFGNEINILASGAAATVDIDTLAVSGGGAVADPPTGAVGKAGSTGEDDPASISFGGTFPDGTTVSVQWMVDGVLQGNDYVCPTIMNSSQVAAAIADGFVTNTNVTGESEANEARLWPHLDGIEVTGLTLVGITTP